MSTQAEIKTDITYGKTYSRHGLFNICLSDTWQSMWGRNEWEKAKEGNVAGAHISLFVLALAGLVRNQAW